MKLGVLLVALLIGACRGSAVPIGPPVTIECVGLQEGGPDTCQRMIDSVQGWFPLQAASARRVLVVDSCPPRAACDRLFLYDAIVIMVPPDDVDVPVLAAHVTGHHGEDFRVVEWAGPLPDHVQQVLAG